jgi:hypothetical protein
MQKNQINSICTTIFNSCQRVIVKQETKHKRNGTITRCQKLLLQIKKNECVKGDLILCQNENPMVHENIYMHCRFISLNFSKNVFNLLCIVIYL